jgi:multidrug efflux pump subunit AcrA (membrane-fusion protein)
MKISHSFPCVTVAAILLSCSPAPPKPAIQSPLQVRVVRLQQQPLPRYLEAVGTVRPRSWVQVSSRIAQNIVELPVREGDLVRAGQVLALLDQQQLLAQEQASAAERAATQQAEYQAEAGLNLAQAEAELARTTFERYRHLLDKHAVSQQEFDQVQARHRVTQAALEQAQAGVEAARSRLQQAESALASAATARGYAQVTAPIAGRVLTREMDRGDLALPGRTILTLGGSDGWRADVSLDAARATQVAVGGACRVESEGLQPVESKIERIVPAADPASRTILVQVGLPNGQPWRAGAIARASFALDPQPGLQIPQAAHWSQGQLEFALVLRSDNRAERRLIRTGPLHNGYFEVLAGLTPNERVVTSNPQQIEEGRLLEAVR